MAKTLPKRNNSTASRGFEVIADVVRANGSISSNQPSEDGIRRTLIETNLLDCMVARPNPRSVAQN